MTLTPGVSAGSVKLGDVTPAWPAASPTAGAELGGVHGLDDGAPDHDRRIRERETGRSNVLRAKPIDGGVR